MFLHTLSVILVKDLGRGQLGNLINQAVPQPHTAMNSLAFFLRNWEWHGMSLQLSTQFTHTKEYVYGKKSMALSPVMK